MTPFRIFLLISTLMLFIGCGGSEIASRWRPNPSDSQVGAPEQAAAPLGDARTRIVVQNDNEFVYIALATSNRDLQRVIVIQGLRWWFDRQGGDKKIFGVRYPAGGIERQRREIADEGKEGNGAGDGGEVSGSRGAESEWAMMPAGEGWVSPVEMDLYVNGEESVQRMTTLSSGGITARFRRSRDTLYYEMKFPIAETGAHPFAIGAKPGDVLGVVVETVAFKPREAMLRGGGGGGMGSPDRSVGGGGGGGGRRSRAGGSGEMGGRGEGESGRSAPRGEQLSATMRVTLAVK